MPAYYLSIEGTKTRERSDPATDKLVSIQYQKIDLATGEPLDVLVILREWESSEKDVVTTFYNQFFRPGLPVTDFIPVGLNLDYVYEMLLALFRKFGLAPPTSHELYYQRLRFDLKPVIVLLNNGSFAGASLDAFSLKKGEDRHMDKWYGKQDFGRIEHYVREEAARFLKVFQYLSRYKTRLGITVKETPASRKTSRTPVPSSGPAPVLPMTPVAPRVRKSPATDAAESDRPVYHENRPASPSPRPHEPRDRPISRPAGAKKPVHQENKPAPLRPVSSRSPAGREQPAARAPETGRPDPRNRPGAKVAPRSLLPAPERTAADKKRSPAGRNQLGKHPSAKGTPARKGLKKR